MATILSLIVTEDGLHLPRQLFRYTGEVEVIERDDYIVVKPKHQAANDLRARALAVLLAAGSLVELGWASQPAPSSIERAELARKFSVGRPLSEWIIEERTDRT